MHSFVDILVQDPSLPFAHSLQHTLTCTASYHGSAGRLRRRNCRLAIPTSTASFTPRKLPSKCGSGQESLRPLFQFHHRNMGGDRGESRPSHLPKY